MWLAIAELKPLKLRKAAVPCLALCKVSPWRYGESLCYLPGKYSSMLWLLNSSQNPQMNIHSHNHSFWWAETVYLWPFINLFTLLGVTPLNLKPNPCQRRCFCVKVADLMTALKINLLLQYSSEKKKKGKDTLFVLFFNELHYLLPFTICFF